MRPLAGVEFRHRVQHHEVVVQRPVGLDRVALPDQPEFLPVTRFQQLDELLLGEVAVILFRHGSHEDLAAPTTGGNCGGVWRPGKESCLLAGLAA